MEFKRIPESHPIVTSVTDDIIETATRWATVYRAHVSLQRRLTDCSIPAGLPDTSKGE